ncbi:hypothetical protein A1356_08285 [Methylomonas koyamae]|uniref:Uncharacterized protein n=1 Tax=Methylomonas koyamae TaxID=702114 RepID=A0AA91DEY0_9GAMM|nr:hypothetical protein A1356_08285 [Methylomonas koyamae]
MGTGRFEAVKIRIRPPGAGSEPNSGDASCARVLRTPWEEYEPNGGVGAYSRPAAAVGKMANFHVRMNIFDAGFRSVFANMRR